MKSLALTRQRIVTAVVLLGAGLGCQRAVSGQSLAIVGAALIDGSGAAPVRDSVIVIDDGRIVAAGARSSIRIPAGTEVFDAQGRWVTPGLIDVHGHFFESGRSYMRPLQIDLTAIVPYQDEVRWTKERVPVTLDRYLCAGVTTVASLGGPRFEREVRDYAARVSRAPSVLVAHGPIGTPLPQPAIFLPFDGDDVVRTVRNATETRREVDGAVTLRADLLKTGYLGGGATPPDQVALFWRDILPALVEAGRQRSLPVVAHVEELDASKRFLQAGVSHLAHPFSDVPPDAAFLNLARARGAIVASTISASMRAADLMARQLRLQPVEERCGDPEVIASWKDLPSTPPPPELVAAVTRSARTAQQNVRSLYDAGIELAVGSDAGNLGLLHGASLHFELALMAAAGIPARDLIVAATRNGARFLGRENEVGTIAPGMMADILILDKDPNLDIANIASIRAVVKKGIIYAAQTLLPPSPRPAPRK